jgi:hypothetical protein
MHYCFKLGYNALADLLICYGGDDTLPNAEGLTPYEGLTMADLEMDD